MNQYYLYGRKQGTKSGYGKTKVDGEFAAAVDAALQNKKVIRARTLFQTEKNKYQVLEVTKFGSYTEIIFMKLS